MGAAMGRAAVGRAVSRAARRLDGTHRRMGGVLARSSQTMFGWAGAAAAAATRVAPTRTACMSIVGAAASSRSSEAHQLASARDAAMDAAIAFVYMAIESYLYFSPRLRCFLLDLRYHPPPPENRFRPSECGRFWLGYHRNRVVTRIARRCVHKFRKQDPESMI